MLCLINVAIAHFNALPYDATVRCISLPYLACMHVCACMWIYTGMSVCMYMAVVENTILLLLNVVTVSLVAFREREPLGRPAISCSWCIVYGWLRTRLHGWVRSCCVWLLWTFLYGWVRNHIFGLPRHFLLVFSEIDFLCTPGLHLVPSLWSSLCPYL